jgi:hypothetical protein
VSRDSKGSERLILKRRHWLLPSKTHARHHGPSGCGKSTLLDTLAGRLASSAAWDGEIRVNGHKSSLSYGKSAYVTQDEMLSGTLTVEETLLFTARLRLPLATDKMQIVDAVISELGLESVRHTYVGNWHLRGISGGQRPPCRHRVRAGHLSHSPLPGRADVGARLGRCVPRDGLCAQAHRGMQDHHHGHPPAVLETFELFDKLLLLAAGDTVYFGDALKAENMFDAAQLPVPPARSAPDHFLHCINRDFQSETFDVERNIARLVSTYRDSKLAESTKTEVAELHANPGEVYLVEDVHPSFASQTGILTWRTLINNWRNIGLFWMRLGMYIVLCLAIGFIYFQLGTSWKDVFSRAALLFFVVAFPHLWRSPASQPLSTR